MIRRMLLCAVLLLEADRLPAAEDPLQAELNDRIFGSHWIYNDLDGAIALAKATRKPLLVMFRCVPCNCAEALDEAINKTGGETAALQQKFVCVRVVHMKGVDLAKFQFDYDVSLVGIMMNADGTIYGRYGTRATLDRGADTHVSLASFNKALERALALHAEYPLNRKELAGKQPLPIDAKKPEQLPYLAKQAAGAVTEKNCIHCHMVGEAFLDVARQEGTLTDHDLWRFPLPDNLGTVIDKEDGLAVKTIRPNSLAAKAGIKPGDEVVAMNGQPLISIADMQWVLHHLPDENEVTLTLQRKGEKLKKTLALTGDWRRTDVVWRPSLQPLRPNVHFRNVSHGTYQGVGIPTDRLLLQVYYPTGPASKAGLRNGDLVTAIDGQDHFMREGDFLDYLYLQGEPKRSVKFDLLRKGEKLQAVLPIE